MLPKKKKMPSSTVERFEKTTDEILQDCVDLRAGRKKQYGGSVFNSTAKIASAIGAKSYDSKDVHIIFLAMKLARYKFQLSLCDEEDDDETEDFFDEEVTCDSVEDAIVYMALMESQRRTCIGSHKRRALRTQQSREQDEQQKQEINKTPDLLRP